MSADVDETARREREFVAFFNAYFPMIRRRAWYLTPARSEIEDICADVFTLAYQRFDELRPLAEPQIHAWLCRSSDLIGRNRRRSAVRRQRLLARLEREPLPAPSTPNDSFELAEQQATAATMARRAREVLAELAPRHRTVLELAEYEGQNGPTIARQLGITPQAARLRLMRARRAFREEYLARFGPDRPGGEA